MAKPEDWQCEVCHGTGMAEPECETCAGNGWTEDEADGGTMTCPDCLGDKCDECGGSGEKAIAAPPPQRSEDAK